jgi:branched-chain amino acid transport system ATP-binding protein
MLEFRNVNTYYGDLHVLKNVNYNLGAGEIICLLGGNACGKSTTMKTIMGIVRPTSGEVIFEGQRIDKLSTAERVRRGIAPVLEARRLFPRMTVFENLEMGAFTRKRGADFNEDLERVYSLFPRVKERRDQQAGTLSGGEQQMVAIGRALMARPKLICMDEPSMGLSPLYVEQTFAIIQTSISARPIWARCRSRQRNERLCFFFQQEALFFFIKKNQKTFDHDRALYRWRRLPRP